MEKHFIEIPTWLHKEIELYKNCNPTLKVIAIIGWVYLAITLVSHIIIIQ